MKPFNLSQYMLSLSQAAGAGFVGYDAGLTYPSGSVGAALHNAVASIPTTKAQFDAALTDGNFVFQLGNASLGDTILTGAGATTGGVTTELGALRTGDGDTYLDFHATPGTDFDARIMRYGGANGKLAISNTGTGGLDVNTGSQSGNLNLFTGSAFNVDGAAFVARGKTSSYNPWGAEIYAGGAQQITISGGGSVGVGTGLSFSDGTSTRLFVNGDASLVGGTPGLNFNSYWFAGFKTYNAGFGGRIDYVESVGDIRFYNALTSAVAGAVSDMRQIARFDKDGSLKIFGGSNQIVLKSGEAANNVSTIFRQDGANFYILLSDPTTAPTAAWNALRPFAVNNTTGRVTMENGLLVTGGSFVSNVTIAVQGAGGTVAELRSNGDIMAHRGNNTGVIYLGNAADHYLYWNNVDYIMPGPGKLFVDGGPVLNMKNDMWHVSQDNYQRFYFAANAVTYIGGTGFTFQSGNIDRFRVDSAGNVNANGQVYAAGFATPSGGYYNVGDDGDIRDLDDGFCSFRFSNGVRIRSGAYTGGAVIDLKSNGDIVGGALYTNYVQSGGSVVALGGDVRGYNVYATNGWLRTLGNWGYYNDTYGRGITVPDGNGSSYGNVTVYGSGMNGWHGICLKADNRTHLMTDGGTIGLYDPNQPRWICQWDYGGNFTASGNVAAYSDLRLKENVRPIDNLIGRRDALATSAIMYEREGRTRIGYGAQTLQELGCGEFVHEADDAMKLVTGLGTLSVDYGETAAILAAASKQTDDRVAVLEAEVARLTALVSRLMGDSTEWK